MSLTDVKGSHTAVALVEGIDLKNRTNMRHLCFGLYDYSPQNSDAAFHVHSTIAETDCRSAKVADMRHTILAATCPVQAFKNCGPAFVCMFYFEDP
jgi:hypothetical protein